MPLIQLFFCIALIFQKELYFFNNSEIRENYKKLLLEKIIEK